MGNSLYHSPTEICRQAYERYEINGYLSIEGVPVNRIDVWNELKTMLSTINLKLKSSSNSFDFRLPHCGIQSRNIDMLKDVLTVLTHSKFTLKLSDNFVPEGNISAEEARVSVLALVPLLQLQNLVALDVSKCNLHDMSYFDRPEVSTNLVRMILSKNALDQESISQLCSFLHRESCQIESLVLDGNSIGDQGAMLLSAVLRGKQGHKKALVHLNVAKNKITNVGIQDLLEALQVNITLESLDMHGNVEEDPPKTDVLVNALVDALRLNSQSSIVRVGVFGKTRDILQTSSIRLGIRPRGVATSTASVAATSDDNLSDKLKPQPDDELLERIREVRRNVFAYRKYRIIIVGAAGSGKAALAHSITSTAVVKGNGFANVIYPSFDPDGRCLDVWYLPVASPAQYAAFSYLFDHNCVVLVAFDSTSDVEKIEATAVEYTSLIRTFSSSAPIILVGTKRDSLNAGNINEGLRSVSSVPNSGEPLNEDEMRKSFEKHLRQKLRDENVDFQTLYIVENNVAKANTGFNDVSASQGGGWNIYNSQIDRLRKGILKASLYCHNGFPSVAEDPNFPSFYLHMSANWFDHPTNSDFLSLEQFNTMAMSFQVDEARCRQAFRNMGYLMDIQRDGTAGLLVNLKQWTLIWSVVLKVCKDGYFFGDPEFFKSICTKIAVAYNTTIPSYVTFRNFVDFLTQNQRALCVFPLSNHLGDLVHLPGIQVETPPNRYSGSVFALSVNLDRFRVEGESLKFEEALRQRQGLLFDRLCDVLNRNFPSTPGNQPPNWKSCFVVFQLTLDGVLPYLMLDLIKQLKPFLIPGFIWADAAIFKDTDASVVVCHISNDYSRNVGVISITSTSSNVGMRLRLLLSIAHFLRRNRKLTTLHYQLYLNNPNHELNVMHSSGFGQPYDCVFLKDITSLFPELPFFDTSDSWFRKLPVLSPSPSTATYLQYDQLPFVFGMEPAQPEHGISESQVQEHIQQAYFSWSSSPSSTASTAAAATGEHRCGKLIIDTVLRSYLKAIRKFVTGLPTTNMNRMPVWIVVENKSPSGTSFVREQYKLVHPGQRLGERWRLVTPHVNTLQRDISANSVQHEQAILDPARLAMANHLKLLIGTALGLDIEDNVKWRVATGIPSAFEQHALIFEADRAFSVVGDMQFEANFANEVRNVQERSPFSWIEFLSSSAARAECFVNNGQARTYVSADEAQQSLMRDAICEFRNIGAAHAASHFNHQLQRTMQEILSGIQRVERMQETMNTHQQQAQRTLHSSIITLQNSVRDFAEQRHECPSYFIIAPEPPPTMKEIKDYVKFTKGFLRDPYIFHKNVFRVYPVCAQTLRPVGKGYEFKVPKDPESFRTVVSVIRASAVVMTIACAAARATTGLPLPVPQGLPRSFNDEMEYFSAMGQALQCIVPDDAWQKDFSRFSKAVEIQRGENPIVLYNPTSSAMRAADASSSASTASGAIADTYFCEKYSEPCLRNRLTAEAHRQMRIWLNTVDPNLQELVKVMHYDDVRREWVSNDLRPDPVPDPDPIPDPIPDPVPPVPPVPNPIRVVAVDRADVIMAAFRRNVQFLSSMLGDQDSVNLSIDMPPMCVVFQDNSLSPQGLSDWYRTIVTATPTSTSQALHVCSLVLHTVCTACVTLQTRANTSVKKSWPLHIPRPDKDRDSKLRKRLIHMLPQFYLGYRMIVQNKKLEQFCEIAGRTGLKPACHTSDCYDELASLLLRFDDNRQVGQIEEKQTFDTSCQVLYDDKKAEKKQKVFAFARTKKQRELDDKPNLHAYAQFTKESQFNEGATAQMKLLRDVSDSKVLGWVCFECAQLLGGRCMEVKL